MKYKKIILICDYGLDDAVATSYILENYQLFEKIEIIPVAGNMPLEISFKNAIRILDNLKIIPDNVRVIDTSFISQQYEYLDYIHGKDGIGDFLPQESCINIEPIEFNTWIKTITNDYLIVSLGPCTVANKILNSIDLPLLIMGGNISQQPNYNGYEFNHGIDISAFEACVKHHHVIATLDTCHNPYCNFYKINIDNNNLSTCFIKRSVELSKQRNEKEAYIYDFITILYLFYPEKFIISNCIDKDGNELSMLLYNGDTLIL